MHLSKATYKWGTNVCIESFFFFIKSIEMSILNIGGEAAVRYK